MPKLNDPNQKEVSCNFKIPKKVYQKFRIIGAERDVTMKELYRRACQEYIDRNEK